MTPDAEFTVDTAGRDLGIRFTLPLHDDTEYTVRVAGVTGLGGGPSTTVTETFRTPGLQTYLLERGRHGDRILRTDLHGADPVPVFSGEHIEDFRATTGHLVISTLDAKGNTALVVTDLQGKGERTLPLPGPGTICRLQSADRGELVGYTFSDAALGTAGARENRLFIASVKDAAADTAPTEVAVSGTEKRVADWRFVPDSDSILVLTYDGRMLPSSADGQDAADLGTGMAIDGIARGSSVAVVERADGMVTVDLTDGTQNTLTKASLDGRDVPGRMGVVTPIPGADGGSIRPYTVLDVAGGTGAGQGVPEGTRVYRVAGDGAAASVFDMPPTDALLQTCVSPSGQYAAITVAPDAVSNSYDQYRMPMPTRVVTHVIALADGSAVHTFTGFDLSWCQVPPPPSQ
ncbi:hypothetical protein [Microbacterium elymi]|uniref:Fibronectin type-III domain-containing protein n=1 Tax=Microbacterium elymi TaxID=2909587 RepID=A0ABY5NMI0_9MICO|nr:hypothetical protein [Microbacterium elymi]UUT36338.1 hypothetical protein L2X98_25675 [Microbacterium elymi]